MKRWFDIKDRGMLGFGREDLKEVTILGRTVKWNEWGISYEGNKKYRRKVLHKFGFDDTTRPLTSNGDREDREDVDEETDLLDKKETKEFRGIAATLNYMSQDGPDLQLGDPNMSTNGVCKIIGF